MLLRIGLWTKTLGSRTGLPRNNMMKALKSLEGKKLIKTVKSVKVRSHCPPSPLTR
jgi:DNA-directed RNA polymerase III subunit RPC6